MKKIFLSLTLLLLIICPALAFTGCKDKGITMSTYFQQKVNYQVYGRSGINEGKLADFTAKKNNNLQQYTKITFSGNTWLYLFNIDKLCFNVYSNKTETIELNIKIPNLSNADDTINGQKEFKVQINLIANKSVPVTIFVNDYFATNTNSTIEINVSDSSCFYQNGQNTGLKFAISGFTLFGNHIVPNK